MIGKERISTTRFWYPNEAPRSVRIIFVFPVLALSPRRSDVPRRQKLPFFILMIRPVLPAAISRSVCRARNAGICSTSQTSAATCACDASCMSVRIGSLSSDLILPRIRSLPSAWAAERLHRGPVGLIVRRLEDVRHSGIAAIFATFSAIIRACFSLSITHGRNQKQGFPRRGATLQAQFRESCSYEIGRVCKLLRLRSQRAFATI